MNYRPGYDNYWPISNRLVWSGVETVGCLGTALHLNWLANLSLSSYPRYLAFPRIFNVQGRGVCCPAFFLCLLCEAINVLNKKRFLLQQPYYQIEITTTILSVCTSLYPALWFRRLPVIIEAVLSLMYKKNPTDNYSRGVLGHQAPSSYKLN